MSTYKKNRKIMTPIHARRTTRKRGLSRGLQIKAGQLASQLLNKGLSASSSIFLACKHTMA